MALIIIVKQKSVMDYNENFKKFLSDEIIYKANQEFWRYTIQRVAGTTLHEWVKNEYVNGQEIRDGNPLFSARVAGDKAIRIVQTSRDVLKPQWASWSSRYQIDNGSLQELVVSLQPYPSTYSDALRLIAQFIAGKYSELQDELNFRYNQ
jgi:hypothetical protein